MKISRHKKVHRILQFYSNNFGFRKPYQVLIDGTLCFAALKNKVHIENQFKKYLEGEVKLLTTECNVIELDKLGSKFSGAAFIIKQYPIHRCGHSKAPKSGSECILDMVSDNSSYRYIVATQDRELQEKLREVAGVPLMYLHMKTPTLEAPSDVTKQAADSQLTSNFQVSAYEKRRLELLDDSPKPLVIQKKRKRKGGPNPLSCKKKKRLTNEDQSSGGKSKQKERKSKPRKRNKNRLVKKVRKELMSSSLYNTHNE